MDKIILLLLFCACTDTTMGQKKLVSEKLVIHPPMKEFFRQHPELKEIRIKKFSAFSWEYEFIEKQEPIFQAANRYNLNNDGDRYFFEKRFDSIPLAEDIYASFLDKKATRATIHGLVRQDSVFLNIEQTLSSESIPEEDVIFEKIEIRVDYQKGLHALAETLRDSLSHLQPGGSDSTVILRGIVVPAGKFELDKIVLGDSASRYVRELVQQINRSGPWIPYETCGRKVKAYKKIFIRLNRDGSYTIAMD